MARLAVALVAAVLAIVAAPASGAPCAGFTDVEDTSPFCPNVAWMKNRSITTGCTLTEYCPSSPVSRLAMAAFMNRLADSLFPLTCGNGQIMKWNGADWACANDNTGGGGGTVTSVSAGTGLQGSPNPITTTGAINLAPSYQLPQGCSNGQVAKSNGAGGWTCAADSGGTGTVTSVTAGTGLTGGTITGSGTIAADTNYLQQRVTGTCAAGSSIRVIDANGTVTCETDDAGPANAFVQGGNAFGATAVLGTTDNQPLDIRVNGIRVMRYEPNFTPNVIGGQANNGVISGSNGATIAGGGLGGATCSLGGIPRSCANSAGNYASVGGGYSNEASGERSTISGGGFNTASNFVSTIAGGLGNTASGIYSTVAGGNSNTASGVYSTIAGGLSNTASGDYSFAAGRRAKATTAGTFMWADSRDFDFQPSVANFFGVRATGGVGLTVAINGATGAVTQFCNLLPNVASWQCVSDRDAKENFAAVDGRDILERLAAMPLSSWNFKGSDPALRMLGPTAQDFYAAFRLGSDDKTIATVNLDGVALAAIQGLNAKLESQVAAKDAEIATLRERLAKVEANYTRDIADLRLAVEVLTARTSAEGRVAQTR